MSTHKRYTSKKVRVTKRSTSGKKRVDNVRRGLEESDKLDLFQCVTEDEYVSVSDDESMTECMLSMNDSEEPSGYMLERQSDEVGWRNIHQQFLKAVTETAAMPNNQVCCQCKKVVASLRCERCGPLGFFCQSCFKQCHNGINIYHTPEKWEDGRYSPAKFEKPCIDVQPTHQCSTKQKSFIQCIDEYGVNHTFQFYHCNCEPITITLARAKLWPATPHNPRYAFSFNLLDLAESLMLECQVALKDFCNALKFLCPFQLLKKKDIYSSLINAFEEYRFMKHKLRHLDFLSSDLDPGNVCPACPQGKGGKAIYAMDALFGLPRKKSAGRSYRDPLHSNLFFSDQSEIDQYVAEYDHSKPFSNDCNDFLAGNALRSATRYKALDETAVFGAACRHEFPRLFINLKHGERLAYPVWLLEKLVKSHSDENTEIFVLYDIACTMVSLLKSHGKADVLSQVKLCLPSFHSFGHKASCQILFSPRRCDGIGLSDGETMERLWSYLRRFSRMTKEMRPSHRVDVLTSALVYYGIRTKEKLPSLLLIRWERCIKAKMVAQEILHQNRFGNFEETLVVVKKWLMDELSSCHDTARSSTIKPLKWQIEYYHILQAFYSLRQLLACGDSQGSSSNKNLFTLFEMKLIEIEKRQSIRQRWLPTDTEFIECDFYICSNKNEQILLQILKAGQRRKFLLNMIKKYADGQKIAKKLFSQISKETKAIKHLLEEYHACMPLGDDMNKITLSAALDPSTIQNMLQKYGSFHAIADGKKREMIDVYLTYKRSEEEVILLMDEIKNVVTYYDNQKVIVQNKIKLIEKDDQYARGSRALLNQMLERIYFYLSESKKALEVMNNKLDTPDEYFDSDDSDDLNSDIDIDLEY